MTDQSENIIITGEPSDFIAAMGATADAAAETAGQIDSSFATAGSSASAAAADISSRFDAAFAETSASAEAASARIDASLATSTESAAAASTGMADEMAAGGLLAGQGLRDGVHEGASGIEDDLGAAGERGGEKLAEGAEGGGEKVKGMLSNLGVPSELVEGWTGLAAGLGATALVAVDLGNKMETADTAIANSAGISAAAAKKIGTAFLSTAGTTEFSGLEMAKAFATVAGQLKSTQGSALDAAQSMQFMSAASDLATAKQIALKTATSTLAATMQAFQLKTKTAASASDVLFESANATGQSITSVGSSLDRVKTKLGGLAPSLQTLSGLLVDMTDHGETGRAAMSSLTTAFTAFLKPAATAAKAQRDLTVATKDLTPTLQALAEQYQAGTISATELRKATTKLTPAQQNLWATFTSSAKAVQLSGQALQKMGINALTATGQLRPLKTIIGQLHQQITGMSTAQATATLTADGFGSSASKLVAVIQSGPAAFDQATTSVTKMGTAHAAAAAEGQTLGVMFKTVKATVEDFVIELGQDLLPAVKLVEDGFVFLLDDALIPLFRGIGDVIDWFKQASPAALAVASAVGLVLTPKIVTLGVEATTAFGKMAAGWATSAAASVTGSTTLVASWLGLGTQAEASAAKSDAAASAISTSWVTMSSSVNASATSASTGIAGLGAETASMGTEDAAMGAEGLAGVTEAAGGMLGPIGLAVGVVGGLAGALVGLFHHSATVHAVQSSIAALNQTIAQMRTTNVIALGTAILHLKTDVGQAQAALGKSTPGTTSFATAAAKVTDLTQKTFGFLHAQANLTANLKTLGSTFGLTNAQVSQFAQSAGINLNKAMTAAQIAQFRKELAASGTAAAQSAAKVTTANTSISASAKTMASNLLASDKTIVTGHKTALATMVALSEHTGAKALASLANSMKGGLPDLEAVDKAMGVDLPTKYMDLLNQNLTRGGFVSMTGLANAVRSQAPTFEGAIRGAVALDSDPLKKLHDDFTKGGTEAMTLLIGAIDHKKGDLSSHSESAVLAAVKAIEKHEKDLGPVGQQLIEGLASGISEGTSAAVDAAVAAVTAAITAAKVKGKIKSPSQAMATTVGVPMAQGVGVGITSVAAAVATQAMTMLMAEFTKDRTKLSSALQTAVQAAISTLTADQTLLGTKSASLAATLTAALKSGSAAGIGTAVAGVTAATAGLTPTSALGSVGSAATLGAAQTVNLSFTFNINGQVWGSVTVLAQQLANSITPLVRTQLLQMKRSMGGTQRVKTGLGLS